MSSAVVPDVTARSQNAGRAGRAELPGGRRARVQASALGRCRAGGRAHSQPGTREGRGIGLVPHRHPCGPWRLARQAIATVRARPRGCGHRRRAGDRRDGGCRRDRVAMPWLGYACGICDLCVSGRETLCLEQKNMGYSFDGTFAEYAVAYSRYVVKVPGGIDPLDAAPLTCAGVTTYKAVKVAGTRSSELVGVFGVGGLGHLAIQYAAIAGGRVIAVDIVRHQARPRPRARRGVHHQRRQRGSGRGDPAPRRCPPGDRAGGLPVRLRAGLWLAAARWHAGLRRAAGRQRGQAADLRNRSQRDHDRRLDRRHAPSCARSSPCMPPAAPMSSARCPLDDVNEAIADVEAGRVAARIVLEP